MSNVLADQLRSIADQIDGVPNGETWRTETGFPKPVLIGGVYFTLAEPINPAWRPSAQAQVYGGAFSGGVPRVLGEPSNGDGSPAFPRRSPAGYPMHYGWTGSALIAPGVINDVDGNYQTDAEVDAARVAVALRQGQGGTFSPGH